MFDVEEARKAVARVRERSIGPETVHDLAALVAAATAHVDALEGDVQHATTQRATETEQLKNQLADADRQVLAAIQARDAAIATEQDHAQIVTLAIELDRIVADIADAKATLAQHQADRAAERAQAAETLAAAAATIATITAERDRALVKVTAHHKTLTRIAEASWWGRLTSPEIAAEALQRGDR